MSLLILKAIHYSFQMKYHLILNFMWKMAKITLTPDLVVVFANKLGQLAFIPVSVHTVLKTLSFLYFTVYNTFER